MLHIAFIFLVLFSANTARSAQTTFLVKTDKTEYSNSINYPTGQVQFKKITIDMNEGKPMEDHCHPISIFDYMSQSKINIR